MTGGCGGRVLRSHESAIDELGYVRRSEPSKGGGDSWAKKWARTTGGVDGKGGLGKKWELGVQADVWRERYLSKMLDEILPPLLGIPAEVVQRRLQMKDLEDVLGKYLIHRMTSES